MDTSRSIAFTILWVYVLGYAPVLAVILNRMLKVGSLSRQRTLTVVPLLGFGLTTVGNYVTYWSKPGLPVLESIYAGVSTALILFVITYSWITNAEHFWRSTLLAGLMTMVTGPAGLLVLRAVVGESAQNWFAVSWGIPFFVLGALTHGVLRSRSSSNQSDYYHLTAGRIMLVILVAPLAALLAWCTSGLVSGYQFVP